MKHNANVTVTTTITDMEAKMVMQGDILLTVDKDFRVVPYYIRDAEFVTDENLRFRMVEMKLGDRDNNSSKERFRDNQVVTVVRIR